MIMKKSEPCSGCLMMVTFICAASKYTVAQNACRYFKKNPRTKLCMWLGNWTQGEQMCDCKEAKDGLLAVAKEG